MTERDYSHLNEFVDGMVLKIHECRDKPSWLLEDLSELYWELEHEVREELKLDLDSYIIASAAGEEEFAERALRNALRETHDVGNYAFMVADKIRVMLAEMDERRDRLEQ